MGCGVQGIEECSGEEQSVGYGMGVHDVETIV